MIKFFRLFVTLIVCLVVAIAGSQMISYQNEVKESEILPEIERTVMAKTTTRTATVASEQAVVEAPSVPSDVAKRVASAKEKNVDVWGELSVPAVGIHETLFQSKDNEDYLHQNINKKYTVEGSVFIDMATPVDSVNTIIYGHNMKNGNKFGRLSDFMEKETFEKDRFIYIYNEDECRTYEIFSVHLTTVEGNELSLDFSDWSEFKDKSLYDTNVDVDANDKILTLVTCHNTTANKDNRLVVQAKLREDA